MDWINTPQRIFNKIKRQMFSKGVQNFYALDSFVKQFDPENKGVLDPFTFNNFCNKVGFFLTTQQIRTVENLYAIQDKEKIHYKKLLEDVKYSIPEKIKTLIDKAFDKLVNRSDKKQVSLARLSAMYHTQNHPRVLTGQRTPQQEHDIFMEGMARKAINGMVSKQAFLDDYAQLNFCMPVEDQQYFEDIINSTWNLLQGENYISEDRLMEIQLVLYEKIRQKSDGKQGQWKAAKKVMAYFDLQDTGKCHFNEFKHALMQFGCTFKQAQLKALFNKFDIDKSGYLNYSQFSKKIMNIDTSGVSSHPNLFHSSMGKGHFVLIH